MPGLKWTIHRGATGLKTREATGTSSSGFNRVLTVYVAWYEDHVEVESHNAVGHSSHGTGRSLRGAVGAMRRGVRRRREALASFEATLDEACGDGAKETTTRGGRSSTVLARSVATTCSSTGTGPSTIPSIPGTGRIMKKKFSLSTASGRYLGTWEADSAVDAIRACVDSADKSNILDFRACPGHATPWHDPSLHDHLTEALVGDVKRHRTDEGLKDNFEDFDGACAAFMAGKVSRASLLREAVSLADAIEETGSMKTARGGVTMSDAAYTIIFQGAPYASGVYLTSDEISDHGADGEIDIVCVVAAMRERYPDDHFKVIGPDGEFTFHPQN